MTDFVQGPRSHEDTALTFKQAVVDFELAEAEHERLSEMYRQTISGLDDALGERDEAIAHLTLALEHRTTTAAAVGFVMASCDMDIDSAFRYLCRISSHRNVKLYEIATEIVETRQVPRSP